MPRPKPDEHTGERSERLWLRLSPSELATYQAAAEREGLYLSDWMRQALDRTAGQAGIQQKRRGKKKSTVG